MKPKTPPCSWPDVMAAVLELKATLDRVAAGLDALKEKAPKGGIEDLFGEFFKK